MLLTLSADHHLLRPFQGAHDFDDAMRLALIIGSAWLILVIGRTMREGIARHDMDRWQLARFVCMSGFAGTVSFRSAGKFGTPGNWALYAVVGLVIVGAYGVLGLRREQRHPTEDSP